MSEPVKKTSSWMTALKQFNEGKQWSVPKKGSPEYDAVKKIQNSLKPSPLTPVNSGVDLEFVEPDACADVVQTPRIEKKRKPRTKKSGVEPTM